jgi:hypothetical protein
MLQVNGTASCKVRVPEDSWKLGEQLFWWGCAREGALLEKM